MHLKIQIDWNFQTKVQTHKVLRQDCANAKELAVGFSKNEHVEYKYELKRALLV